MGLILIDTGACSITVEGRSVGAVDGVHVVTGVVIMLRAERMN